MKTKNEVFNECYISIKQKGINLTELLCKIYGKTDAIPAFALIVEFVNLVMQELENLGHPIRYHRVDMYIFNGVYWEQITKKERERLLPVLAQVMGISRHKSLHHKFVKEMNDQFCSFVSEIKVKNTENQIHINLNNGTLAVKEGKVELLPHSKQQLLTYVLPYAYDPDAKCPRFQKFLDEVLSKDSQKLLQEHFAYILSPYLNLQKALFLQGGGANGKSVYIKILSAVLGKENITERTLEGLCALDSRSAPDLEQKLLVVCGEMSAKFDIAKFKAIVAGDPLEARRLYGDCFTVYNYGKLLISCNEMPRQIEHTEAFFRRILLIPFERHFTVEEQDPLLADKIIKDELPGILNWGLEALPRLLEQQHFSRCEASEKALDEYKRDIDSVASFIQDNNYQTSTNSFTPLKLLFPEYVEYCKEINCYACKRPTFSARLRMMGYKEDRRSGGMIFFINKKAVVDIENAQLFSSIEVKNHSEEGMSFDEFCSLYGRKEA